MIPATMRSSVLLPEPLRPTSASALPGSTANETSRSAHTSAGPARGRAEARRLFSVRVPRARRRGSAARASSTRISPRAHEHPAPARRATRARARIRGRRSASRFSRSVIPSSRARSCASTSMSQRISRWSETKPTGHTSTSRTPRACRSSGDRGCPGRATALRSATRSGSRTTSRRARRAPRRGAHVSRSCSWYGSPSSRMRAGSECAVKTTCAFVPRTRSASTSTNGSKSCQLSIMRSSARPRERLLELRAVAGDRQARVVRREHEPDDDVGAGRERGLGRLGDARRPVLHAGEDRQRRARARARRASPR